MRLTHHKILSFDIKIVLGVVGAFLFFMGFALLLPLFIDLIYQEDTWQAFLVSAVISFGIGGGLFKAYRPKRELKNREAFLIVSLTWITLSMVGAIPFVLAGVTSSFTDAFFETMSGLTTTGATIFGGTTASGQVNPAIEMLPKSLLFWRSLSHWLGGMGIIVLSIAILPLLGFGGMQLFQAEAPGPTTDKLTPRVQNTAKLLWLVYAGFTFVEFILLWLHPSMDWFDAINHAFATMATGGFSTKNGSVTDFNSIYIDVIITLFMFFAGVNFALHFRLFRGQFATLTSNRELRFYGMLTVASVLVISASLWYQSDYSIGDAIRYGSFQAVSIITTTGFGTADYELWPTVALFVLLLLFFTGGCAGSTAGGPKMIRWLILIRNSFKEITQTLHPKAILPVRIGSFAVEPAVVRTVLSFFILYLFLFATSALILSFLGLDFISALGASIACLGNIGPGLGNVGPTDNFAYIPDLGKWVLSLAMMIGRLELFTVLILFSPKFWHE
ncbi:TrkH family potassium uptake protein [bacterium]|nr:MAG: TrkH family potassium uptake protein [bacterium]